MRSIMKISDLIENPVIELLSNELLKPIAALVVSIVIPKVKRMAFEKMSEGLQEFGEFILEQKAKVESTETIVDDEAYNISKEAFKVFLDEANALYLKL